MDRKVTVAEGAGFCFGVERTVDQVYEQIEALKSKKMPSPTYTYGPTIHSEEVVKNLLDKGVMVLKTEDELRALPKSQGTVVIQSRGVSRHVYKILKKRSMTAVDATCPFVKKIYRIVTKHSAAGEAVVIIKSPDHPEVEGIKGWGSEHTTVIEDEEGVDNHRLPEDWKLYIMSQAASNYNKFKELVRKFLKKSCDSSALNTIRNVIQERQVEVARVASQVDAMIVTDGRHSSNIQKLYEICLKGCKDTSHIQTFGDLDPDSVPSVCSIDITTGASAPRKIIEEVRTRVTEQSLTELSKEEEESTKPIRTGEIVIGRVIEVNKDEIILSIAGNKSKGAVTRDEHSNNSNVNLTTKVQISEETEAGAIKLNDGVGMVSLSCKRMAADRGNKHLEEALENQGVLIAEVTQVLDGGLSVEVEGVRVFISASLIFDSYKKDLSKYTGQGIDSVITESSPERRRTIGDKRQLPVTQKMKLKEGLLAGTQPDDTVNGTAKNVTGFGVFIDLDGANGLLHTPGVNWDRAENPKKVFKAGDQVRVLIKDVQGERIALSFKFPEANPWVNVADKHTVGDVVYGRVVCMTDLGAFVELEPGVDVLPHISQIPREHAEKPADVLRVGQEIEAKVVDFNEANYKISLSTRAMLTSVVRSADMTDMDINVMSQYTER